MEQYYVNSFQNANWFKNEEKRLTVNVTVKDSKYYAKNNNEGLTCV